nr:EOG090X0GHI [Eulimnadia texana]
MLNFTINTVLMQRWINGPLARLPECYKKFYFQWQYGPQTPVHYIPKPGKWERNPESGEVKSVQNVPIPLTYPKEFHEGLWGGEAVIRGFQKRQQLRRRVPHYWVPNLKKAVIYSEILDKYFEVVVTERTLQLIDQHFGFDSYILKTPPQDLKSLLGIKFKRTLLLALARKDFLPNKPDKREELLNKYKDLIVPEEEAEWYGLTIKEAMSKLTQLDTPPVQPVPLKQQFREEFINELKEVKPDEVEVPSDKPSWFSKINPFASKTT